MALALVERIESSTQSRYVLDGRGPACASYWQDFRGLEAMLSEKHSTALYMAQLAKERGDLCRKFETDIPQSVLDKYVAQAPSILRKLDRDIQSIIQQGGSSDIVYLNTLSTVRAAMTDTITHLVRIVGR
jgi:hypothetical protein